MSKPVDNLATLRGVLQTGGFTVESLEINGLGSCLLAETPHAVVLVTWTRWDNLRQTVEEAQAVLTNLSARHPSPRGWDLYVVAVVDHAAGEAEEVARERVEHDTRFARKFVLAGEITPSRAQRALRPLLPLHVPPSVHLADPLATLQNELLKTSTDAGVVEHAIHSFRESGDVEIK